MINDSGLIPKGRAVLIKPYEPDRGNGIIAIPDSVKVNMQVIEQRAIVVATGSACWKDEDEPRAIPGDHVLVSAYAGYMAKGPKDNEQYRFVNDKDIFAVITGENNE